MPEGPTEPPHVTAVVSHYRQPRELRRTLAALARQDHPAERLEVVVADDGSPEAPDLPPGVRLVRQADRGFRLARVRNLGASVAAGDVLVFLDADTAPEPGFVRNLTRLPALLPEAVVVGRRRYADLSAADPDAGRVPVESAAPDHLLPGAAWLDDAWAGSQHLLRADELSFRHVLGGVLACSARFFAETGGFDETFTRYGGEDWEWAHVAWTHGAVLAHEPAAVAWHDGVDRSRRPGWGTDGEGTERMRAETAEIAARVPVPGVAPSGLITRAADPLVTVEATIGGDALVVLLDGVLRAFPRARVLLDDHDVPPVLLGEPRLVRRTGGDLLAVADRPEQRGSWRHLHVRRAVHGGVEAWVATAEPTFGPEAAGRVRVRVGAEEVLTWTLLRAERRRRRWGEAAGFADREVESALERIGADVSLPAVWGGWG